MKKIIKKLFRKYGYDLTTIESFPDPLNPYNTVLPDQKIVDLEAMGNVSESIQGMITSKSGQILYSLCYMQEMDGDVVEIGSWQGKSASFLARAVKNSGNGRFYAIDHFKGNVGKEDYYVVGKKDLSDLKTGFINNMKKTDLYESVNLLDMPNEEAAINLKDNKVRFLFIDGDHTKAGVQKDIDLFFPMLEKGSIVAIDDYEPVFEGLVSVIDELLKKNKFARVMTYKSTLVVKL